MPLIPDDVVVDGVWHLKCIENEISYHGIGHGADKSKRGGCDGLSCFMHDVMGECLCF
jgi:hypothetical protein